MRLYSVFKGAGLFVFFASLLTPVQDIRAEVPLDGSFVAGENCSAFQSIRKQSNPVRLETGHSYEIVAANKEAASHYMIIVPGATPERRWAPVGCGKRDGGQPMDQDQATVPAPQPDDGQAQGKKKSERTQYVLAASWQPAFCETKPDKVECRTQTSQRFDASHFALHGLWPQPRSLSYCRVERPQIEDDEAGRWDELPAVALEPATEEELSKVMPGTQSHLERHEWTKHGTCYATTAEEYFADALGVMRALNGSAVQELFASRIGQFVSFEEIRKAFDQSFGAGAGRRVRMQCARDNGRLIISGTHHRPYRRNHAAIHLRRPHRRGAADQVRVPRRHRRYGRAAIASEQTPGTRNDFVHCPVTGRLAKFRSPNVADGCADFGKGMNTTTRRRLMTLLASGAAAFSLAGAARGAPQEPAQRAIPSSGERLPAIGLGSWITFNVGDDPVLRDECADGDRGFLRSRRAHDRFLADVWLFSARDRLWAREAGLAASVVLRGESLDIIRR